MNPINLVFKKIMRILLVEFFEFLFTKYSKGKKLDDRKKSK